MNRSTVVLLGGVAAAVAVGAAAALLKPKPPTLPTSPTNVAIPVPAGTKAPDAQVVQVELLEKLIVKAETADDVGALPSLETFVLIVQKDPEGAAWVVDRLAREDATQGLRHAFVADLPKSRRDLDDAVDRLLRADLEGGDAAAIELLVARGVVEDYRLDRECDCFAGTYRGVRVEVPRTDPRD